jgi:predicted transcriptional regulator YdeE
MNSWDGEKMGKGSQTISAIVPNESFTSDMKFEMTKDAVHKAGMTLTPEGEATKVTWTYEGADTPFLIRGMMTLMGMEKSLGNDYEAGLKSLKELVEAKPKAEPLTYEIVDIKDSWYLGKNFAAVKMDEADSSMFGSAYEAVMKAAADKCSKEDMPFCIARNIDYKTGVMDLEMGMVTTEEMKADGFVTGKIPAGKCVKYVYYGPYEGTGPAWTNLMTQIAKDGLKPRWDGYEVYANDPMIVKDPAKFETWLMQPVE